MNLIRVVVNGALGKMGREILKALCLEPETQLAGAVEQEVDNDQLPLPDGSGTIPFSADLDHILTTSRADVLVDFTVAQATLPAARIAAKHGVNLVIGTTGLSPDDISEIKQLATTHKIGAVVAPNFSLSAVLMMHLAQIAAKHLDCAEIIELHHNKKVDAPSGTSLTTARTMAQARGKPFLNLPEQKKAFPSRGEVVEDIPIHSVRLPGLLAHQEVILGGPGQTLTIRQDTISRECYIPGIIIAIKAVIKRKGLVYGLDTLLGLADRE